jgi:hypothetical protein
MTAGHIDDELPALLTGEADRDTVTAAAAHLRGCEDCRHDLVSALVAHAALASAARFAPDVVALSSPGSDQPDQPGNRPGRQDADTATPADAATLPDLDPVLAHTRRLPASGRGASVRALWIAAAAVLGFGAGIGGVLAVDHLRTPAGRTVQLAAFDKGTVAATAEIIDGTQLRMRAGALPPPGPDRIYEVWLTNNARTQMYAVGSLPAGRTGSFTVASALLHRYTAIEVSVQPLNNSGYSGTSVLRGRYS